MEGSAASPARGRQGRGRAARRDRRMRASVAAPAYITRRIPPYEILSEEEIVRIEETTDRILEEIGIRFQDDPRCLELWREAGADVTGDLVRFPRGLVRHVLSTAPAVFTQHARNPERSVKFGGDHVVFVPSYGSPFVMDLDRGRRYGTIEDFRNFVKLGYSSPWLHHSGGTVCEPTDVPVNKRHLDMVYSHIRYSDRAFLGSITAEERAEDSIAMARLVFGEDFVEQNCVVMGNVNCNSPLVWDAMATKSIRAYARANQGSVIAPFILGGAMGPVTTAGAVAQAHAEAMVGCALSQLERPGAPTIYGNFLSSTQLRTGSPTFGTPEPAVGSLVVGQLCRRLNLPLRCSGAFTTSKLPDAQAMMESASSMHASVLSGANFAFHAAGFLDGLLSMSYEKFVMDADYCGHMHAYLAGVPTDDNQLAFSALAEGGPGQHLFGSAHTLANYETAYWESDLSDSMSYEQWTEAGSEDAATRANKRWKRLLDEYEAPPIDPGIDEALLDFMARKKASLPDEWH